MTSNEMILTKIPAGYCAHNIAPLGEDPNWVIMTHRIIDIVTGVKPQELRFTSEESAKDWLEGYQVSQQYKTEHYRDYRGGAIVSGVQLIDWCVKKCLLNNQPPTDARIMQLIREMYDVSAPA